MVDNYDKYRLMLVIKDIFGSCNFEEDIEQKRDEIIRIVEGMAINEIIFMFVKGEKSG